MSDSLDTSSEISKPTFTPANTVVVPVTNSDQLSLFGSITKADHMKNIRDTVIAGIAMTLPDVLQQLQMMQFGRYEDIVKIVIAFALFMTNRYFNIVRPS